MSAKARRERTMIVLFANVALSREQALLYSLPAFAPLMLTAVAGGIIYVSRASVIGVKEPARDPASEGAEI